MRIWIRRLLEELKATDRPRFPAVWFAATSTRDTLSSIGLINCSTARRFVKTAVNAKTGALAFRPSGR